MGDDRFSYLHLDESRALSLLDELDDKLGWDLPEDDIKVPLHHLPPYQDEEDETVLPSHAHPSYPYGIPHPPSSLSTSSSSSSRARPPSSSLFPHSLGTTSLATSLPVLQLRKLNADTTFGEAKERGWSEMALDGLLTKEERKEVEEDFGNQGNDPPQPSGQNAGDHPEEEEGEDGEGV